MLSWGKIKMPRLSPNFSISVFCVLNFEGSKIFEFNTKIQYILLKINFIMLKAFENLKDKVLKDIFFYLNIVSLSKHKDGDFKLRLI